MIRIEELTRIYQRNGVAFAALNKASMHIAPGDYAAIVGPSGSGKSTLMNLLGCLDRPTSGRYWLHGRDVSTLAPQQLAQVRGAEIGFVFQGFQLLPALTAGENVALPLLLSGMPLRARRTRAAALLGEVGLSDRIDHRPGELSGGQQQRVAIARALARDPAVLLADEPTGNLDEQATGDVLTLLDRLHAQGRTIVLITHDPRVAARADRVFQISDGILTEIFEKNFKFVTI